MGASLLALFWEGFERDSYEPLGTGSLLIRLKPNPSRLPCCSGCGQPTFLLHDTSCRRVRERYLRYRVWLEAPVRRVRCPACGPRRDQIDWLAGR